MFLVSSHRLGKKKYPQAVSNYTRRYTEVLIDYLIYCKLQLLFFFQTNAVIVTFLVTILVPQHHTILCIFVQQLHLSSSRDKLDQSGDPSGIGLLSSFVGKGPLFLIGF